MQQECIAGAGRNNREREVLSDDKKSLQPMTAAKGLIGHWNCDWMYYIVTCCNAE
jgi:hypothetical protein